MKEKAKKVIKIIFRKENAEWINNHYMIFCLYQCVILNLIMEMICRHSFWQPFGYLFGHFVMFIFNAMILLLFLAPGYLFRRRIMYNTIMTVVLLAFAITNGILLCFRVTPFAAVDFLLITSALKIARLYMHPALIVLILAAIVLLIGLSVFLGMKLPKYNGKRHIFIVLILTVVYAFSLIGLNNVLINIGVATKNFANLTDAYHDYGFPYCFMNSVINLGMRKPRGYSAEKIGDILEKDLDIKPGAGEALTPSPTVTPINGHVPNDGLPDVIVIQLESFFDPYTVKGLELSQDPIPYFRELLEAYSSGYLYVPSVGAGTANTEFEVLTGMDLDFFGPGEYPYKTILKSVTCESIANNMRQLGYQTHAIHNNDGTFYDRHIVFSQLGFDTFTPIEYMYDPDRNLNGFARDSILTGEILKALDSTQGRDVVFAISVQAHGDYPTKRMGDDEPIFVRYSDQSMDYAWSYYVNQIADDDRFIKNLLTELEKRKEPVIVIFYGDHLPYMKLTPDDVRGGVLTATQYVIWDNMGLEKQDMDLEAYQLVASALEKVNISQGILTKLHQNCMEDEDYLEKLEMIQYDMLYGDMEVYGGENPYPPTKLQMGTEKIVITAVEEDEGIIYVNGNGFNEYSRICVNGSSKKTTYVSRQLLILESASLSEGDIVTVAQIDTANYVLGETEGYRYE